MILFYGTRSADRIILDADDSLHCVKVLRHREGDLIPVIDGSGTLFECEIEDASVKGVVGRVVSRKEDFGVHPYRLVMAVCPTKNIDRYEWFVEKATEFGVDVFVPVVGDRSERKVLKADRLRKIIRSATKQSLKGRLAEVGECCSVRDFIRNAPDTDVKLIACCEETEDGRKHIVDVLPEDCSHPVDILIGPEGDFSPEELALAKAGGFVAVSLGDSRLRTETAALSAVAATYFKYR